MEMKAPQSSGDANTQVRKLALYVIAGFAIVGLITGFTVAGVTRPTPPKTAIVIPTHTAQPTAKVTNHVTPSPTVQQVVDLAPPTVASLSSDALKADGTTVYMLSMQAIAKANKQPIHAQDITCKIWMVQRIPDGDDSKLSIDAAVLQNVSGLSQPIQGKVKDQPYPEVASMVFNGTTPTPQTGFCKPDGTMTWNFTIVPTTPKGQYDLVILTDWQGKHWNWSWAHVDVV
jgi:hypothetical protein